MDIIGKIDRYILENDEGKMELLYTSVNDARQYIQKILSKSNRTLDKIIPNFNEHYIQAQRMAKMGYVKRKDMPVISSSDIKSLQHHLTNGFIDRNPPFSINTKPNNDDVIKVSKTTEIISKLKPIQKQIYLDKAAVILGKKSISETKKFLETKIFVVNTDNYIIDGHHRYLAGMILDPTIKVSVLKIDMNKDQLLSLTKSFSNAIGNKRNV
ncbi:MAG: hypothetical protein KQ78_02260 [Candidatus Izimaplasma bacterium HR2]|nr:MAG: hypothetical protein KQ78_02260 [Candidatus Izimaplasma bacterium HR2]